MMRTREEAEIQFACSLAQDSRSPRRLFCYFFFLGARAQEGIAIGLWSNRNHDSVVKGEEEKLRGSLVCSLGLRA